MFDLVGNQPIVDLVWREKYRHVPIDGTTAEESRAVSLRRVAEAVFAAEHAYRTSPAEIDVLTDLAYDLMLRGDWAPAGRVHAGAGTGKRVTLINCFVSPEIQDSMETDGDTLSQGIMDALKVSALTLQMHGGIGMDFTPLRPKGSPCRRGGAFASGPLSFADMWDGMSSTIVQGSRRGAMMGVLDCTHPDIYDFITAKQTPGRLTRFNLSVLVTDAFMQAVRDGKKWELGHWQPPLAKDILAVHEYAGREWYVWKVVDARELWNRIVENTYVYAEPGVIFIDRINTRNPLYYCETIRATNPCGEQPLPPNGACNLGAVNLSVMVKDPFGDKPEVDYGRLGAAVALGMRFLDNVLDVTVYPTQAQETEARAKRRIGLGVTGLGTMLQMMKLRYGSEPAIQLTRSVMQTVRDIAYSTSMDLAYKRGTFPAYDIAKHKEGWFVKRLPERLQEKLSGYGMRNGVCLTIAPTGTTSLYYGNPSSGCEPSFDWTYWRKVLRADGQSEQIRVEDYGWRLFNQLHPGKPLPDYMVTANQLTVRDHVVMQAACQDYVDSSISKTVNCPESMTIEQFRDVYTMAYDCGLKGCTTYRPDPRSGRGAVLTSEPQAEAHTLRPRPERLSGETYKIKAPGMEHAMYLTINNESIAGKIRPHEMFINSKFAADRHWTDALTRTISATMRLTNGQVSFLADELKQVHAATGGFWVGEKYVPSVVALIGMKLEEHLNGCGVTVEKPEPSTGARACPKCNANAYVPQENCWRCTSCGYNSCG